MGQGPHRDISVRVARMFDQSCTVQMVRRPFLFSTFSHKKRFGYVLTANWPTYWLNWKLWNGARCCCQRRGLQLANGFCQVDIYFLDRKLLQILVRRNSFTNVDLFRTELPVVTLCYAPHINHAQEKLQMFHNQLFYFFAGLNEVCFCFSLLVRF